MPQSEDLLAKLGVLSDSLDRIRLARGVVGKTSYVVGAGLLVFGGSCA